MTDYSAENWDALALVTGKVTLQWSAIHGWVEIMFNHFSGMPPDKAESIFFEIRNDRVQREMVVKLVKHTIPERPDLIAELEKLFAKMARQSKRRNEAIHLLWQKHEWTEITENDRMHLIIRSPHLLRKASQEGDITKRVISELGQLADSLQETERLTFDLWRRLMDHHIAVLIEQAKAQREKPV